MPKRLGQGQGNGYWEDGKSQVPGLGRDLIANQRANERMSRGQELWAYEGQRTEMWPDEMGSTEGLRARLQPSDSLT